MSSNATSTLAEGRHVYRLRVYYEDTDAAGIVYHANFLRYAERARTEVLRALGVPHAKLVHDCNLMFVVRRAKLDYLRPARLDDSLQVVTEPLALRAATVRLRQEIRNERGACAVHAPLWRSSWPACRWAATGQPAFRSAGGMPSRE